METETDPSFQKGNKQHYDIEQENQCLSSFFRDANDGILYLLGSFHPKRNTATFLPGALKGRLHFVVKTKFSINLQVPTMTHKRHQ